MNGRKVWQRIGFVLAGALVVMLLGGCQMEGKPTITTVENLDLDRFMGDWYVVGNIPTVLERGAHNAVESYTLMEGGRVDTQFRFRDGGFDGPLKQYNPTGFVSAEDPAIWGMQFLWPIKAEFLVIYLDDDYRRTIIGRSKRDYVWLMARQPELSQGDYQEMLDAAAAAGYDTNRIRKVPQRWPEGS